MDEQLRNDLVKYVGRRFVTKTARYAQPPKEDGAPSYSRAKAIEQGYFEDEGFYFTGDPEALFRDMIQDCNGDPDYWDALAMIAARHLRRGDRLPRKLAEWAGEVLNDQVPGDERKRPRIRPRPTHRQGPRSRPARNNAICIAIQELVWMSESWPSPLSAASACQVVASAFCLAERSVADIWEARDHAMFVEGWGSLGDALNEEAGGPRVIRLAGPGRKEK